MIAGANSVLRTIFVVATVAAATSARAAPDAGPDYTGGFRLESDPKIETVFGDAEQFRRYIDRFYAVHAEMQKTREDFSRNVQAVLASLAADLGANGRPAGKCPVDAVALTYARAFRLGTHYHRLGKELEAQQVSIRELDSLGETSGLTPDYRWRVARVFKLYPEVLKDFREMRVAFQAQLAGEIRFHGCDVQGLIAKGEELEKAGAPPTAATARAGAQARPSKKDAEKLAPPVAASTATFFIDNTSCAGSLRVYLDGSLLGEVASSAKAAFQALVGRHDLCLIPSTSQQQCGDPGTLRRTYIHDGWSITLRCD
jgi:hypothetical protein